MITNEQLKEFKLKIGEDNKDLIALGIDQGYANLGYSIINFNLDKNTYTIEESGTITTCSTLPMNKRLLTIYNFINDILDKHPYVKIAGCERLFHNKPMGGKQNFFQQRNKSASIMKTNMATGVLYLLCAEKDIEINDFPPTTVKKYLTGSGKSEKGEVEKAVNLIASNQGINIETDHQSDSIAIGITAINSYIETILYGVKVQSKPRKKTKDFIELNSKNHSLNKLYIKKCIVKLKEENDLRNDFLAKYSKEHKLRTKKLRKE